MSTALDFLWAPPLPPYPYSHIYVAAVPIVLHIHRHNCPPPVSTSNFVCHPHYSTSLPHLLFHPHASLLFVSTFTVHFPCLPPPKFISFLNIYPITTLVLPAIYYATVIVLPPSLLPPLLHPIFLPSCILYAPINRLIYF